MAAYTYVIGGDHDFSDPAKAVWMAYDVKPDGTVANGRVLRVIK